MLGLQCGVAALPASVALLGDAEFYGDLGLSEAELLAGSSETLTKFGACGFGRTTRNHAGKINLVFGTYGKCLHDLQSIA